MSPSGWGLAISSCSRTRSRPGSIPSGWASPVRYEQIRGAAVGEVPPLRGRFVGDVELTGVGPRGPVHWADRDLAPCAMAKSGPAGVAVHRELGVSGGRDERAFDIIGGSTPERIQARQLDHASRAEAIETIDVIALKRQDNGQPALTRCGILY